MCYKIDILVCLWCAVPSRFAGLVKLAEGERLAQVKLVNVSQPDYAVFLSNEATWLIA